MTTIVAAHTCGVGWRVLGDPHVFGSRVCGAMRGGGLEYEGKRIGRGTREANEIGQEREEGWAWQGAESVTWLKVLDSEFTACAYLT